MHNRNPVEQALAAAQLDLYSVLETAPDAIAVVDTAQKLVVVNHQMERLFGYDRA